MSKLKDYWNGGKKNKIIVIIVALFLISLIGSLGGGSNSANSGQKAKPQKIEMADLSAMSQQDAENWCKENKVTFKTKTEYSSDVAVGGFISQSIAAGKKFDVNSETLELIYSKGPKPTRAQINAYNSAKNYLASMAFSRSGLIEQLSSEYGEQYAAADAEYAVARLEQEGKVDWNEEAYLCAKQYLESQSFSEQGLIDQLIFEGFTQDQATYGAHKAYSE